MGSLQLKFFYLDEEGEIISISSQADLTEALNIDDSNALRLAVAANMKEAMLILKELMLENQSFIQ